MKILNTRQCKPLRKFHRLLYLGCSDFVAPQTPSSFVSTHRYLFLSRRLALSRESLIAAFGDFRAMSNRASLGPTRHRA